MVRLNHDDWLVRTIFVYLSSIHLLILVVVFPDLLQHLVTQVTHLADLVVGPLQLVGRPHADRYQPGVVGSLQVLLVCDQGHTTGGRHVELLDQVLVCAGPRHVDELVQL